MTLSVSFLFIASVVCLSFSCSIIALVLAVLAYRSDSDTYDTICEIAKNCEGLASIASVRSDDARRLAIDATIKVVAMEKSTHKIELVPVSELLPKKENEDEAEDIRMSALDKLERPFDF